MAKEKRVTIMVIDRDSSRTSTQSFPVNKDLQKSVDAFTKELGYRKFYLEAEDSDGLTKKEWAIVDAVCE